MRVGIEIWLAAFLVIILWGAYLIDFWKEIRKHLTKLNWEPFSLIGLGVAIILTLVLAFLRLH